MDGERIRLDDERDDRKMMPTKELDTQRPSREAVFYANRKPSLHNTTPPFYVILNDLRSYLLLVCSLIAQNVFLPLTEQV
jgi:hypothetical protein